MIDHDDYGFYDDWRNRSDDERGISLDEYEETRACEAYGDSSHDSESLNTEPCKCQ